MTLRKTLAATAVLVAMALVVAAASGQGDNARGSTRAGGAVAAATGPTASAASRYHRFRGTVTSVRRGRWFGMHTTTGQRVRIYVNGATHWDGCDWDDMHGGYHMTVRAYRSHWRWMASHMQSWHGDWGDGWDMGPGMMG